LGERTDELPERHVHEVLKKGRSDELERILKRKQALEHVTLAPVSAIVFWASMPWLGKRDFSEVIRERIAKRRRCAALARAGLVASAGVVFSSMVASTSLCSSSLMLMVASEGGVTRRSAIAELLFFAGDDSEGREKLKVRKGKGCEDEG